MEDNNLMVFKMITNIVNKVNEMCGENHLNIQLYNRLLEKTTLTNTTSIEKHISIFKEFCVSNKKSIMNRDYDKFESDGVNFSDNIFINFKSVFEEVNEEEGNELWGMLVNLLKNNIPKNKNFLANLMGKIEGSVDVNTNNPMEAITSMMSSGVFSELVGTMTSGLSSGEITLGSLFGQMNDLTGALGEGQNTSTSTRGVSRPKRNRKTKKPKRK